MARTVFLVLSLFGLAACDPFTGTLVAANMATLMHGDKTIPDYVFSSHTRQNCSLLHASRNEEYCQDDPPSDTEALAALNANRYCYRTLGGIDCYDRPDFLAGGQTRVNFAAGGYLPDRNNPVPLELRDTNGLAMSGIPAPVAEIPGARPAQPVMAKAPVDPAKKPGERSAAPATAEPRAKEAATTAKTASKPAKLTQKDDPERTPEKISDKAAKPAPKAAEQVSLNPPPPAAAPTNAAGLAQVPLLRALGPKVAPLANLPGQGTY